MNRPTAVTVFGVLNVAFGIFGLLGIMGSVALLMLPANTNNPVVKIIHENAAYAAWLKVCIPLGLLSCAALLAAGIGLFWLKPWARVLSIGYSIYAIGFGILSIILNFFFLVRPMIEQARHESGPEVAGAIGGAVGSSVGGCFGLIYPIVLLVFMLRPRIVAAFQRPPPL